MIFRQLFERESSTYTYLIGCEQTRQAVLIDTVNSALDQYLQLLDALKTAIEESERLRWELKLAEIAVDVWRTKESSKRQEMKGYRV